MEKQPSESLKRTCLICGCHTNQTINIYEPRGGPNIVQLIQAKFKFQPLNEDKYLCYSCNNWLINWHSLQAMNSNDASSPSGTFRAQQQQQHLNGGAAGGGQGHGQKGGGGGGSGGGDRCLSQPFGGVDEAFGGKPVALVRPRQVLSTLMDNQQNQQMRAVSTTTTITTNTATKAKPTLTEFTKMSTSISTTATTRTHASSLERTLRQRQRRQQRRRQRQCRVCGVTMTPMSVVPSAGATATPHCAKCRAILKWRTTICEGTAPQHPQQQLPKSLGKRTSRSRQSEVRKRAEARRALHLVSMNQNRLRKPEISGVAAPANSSTTSTNTANNTSEGQRSEEQQLQQQPQQLLPRSPTIDGKMIAKLRRLGTTLSREQDGNSTGISFPLVSAAAPTTCWTRQLDDDEILLDFDTAISEVLPRLTVASISNPASTTSPTELSSPKHYSYQLANVEPSLMDTSNMEDDDNDDNESDEDIDFDIEQKPTFQLPTFQSVFMPPRGLSISLI